MLKCEVAYRWFCSLFLGRVVQNLFCIYIYSIYAYMGIRMCIYTVYIGIRTYTCFQDMYGMLFVGGISYWLGQGRLCVCQKRRRMFFLDFWIEGQREEGLGGSLLFVVEKGFRFSEVGQVQNVLCFQIVVGVILGMVFEG